MDAEEWPGGPSAEARLPAWVLCAGEEALIDLQVAVGA